MIVATAGHVDHGKTELVKALTGIETDRLAEEKRRGLTIELGFAYPESGNGAGLGFVDVPGHERFIHTMLAGVAAIDFALVVVAADDGVMPQTREHVAILDLLGVKQGAVALSKADLVDDKRLTVVKAQVETLLADTTLGGATYFSLSARTGEGIDALKAHIEHAASEYAQAKPAGNFRLAIDRQFSMPGAGLVVTGAVFAGEARVDDRLIVSPQGITVRVRSIQSHNRETGTARQGERCALNIVGPDLKNHELKRGDWIVAERAHAPTARFDGKLRVLGSEDKPLKHWSQVHLHCGSRHEMAHVAILGAKKIEPGETGSIQIVLDTPVNVWARDRFVVRDPSAQRTLGGGYVVDTRPPARGRARPERLAQLAAMDQESAHDSLAALIETSENGVTRGPFASTWNLTSIEEEQLLNETPHVQYEGAAGISVIAPKRWHDVTHEIASSVRAWHEREPQSVGPDLRSLRNCLAISVAADLLSAAVSGLIASGSLVRKGARFRLPDHRVQLSSVDEALWRDIKSLLEGAHMRPPVVRELADSIGRDFGKVEKFLRRATDLGLVVQVAKNRFYLPPAISELAKLAEDLCAKEPDQTFEAAAFRDRSGIGRNLAIDVLEFFDRQNFTKRRGNARQLRAAATDIFGSPSV